VLTSGKNIFNKHIVTILSYLHQTATPLGAYFNFLQARAILLLALNLHNEKTEVKFGLNLQWPVLHD
jgi:hypothetical protein